MFWFLFRISIFWHFYFESLTLFLKYIILVRSNYFMRFCCCYIAPCKDRGNHEILNLNKYNLCNRLRVCVCETASAVFWNGELLITPVIAYPSRSRALPPDSPLRTAQASFPAWSSSTSESTICGSTHPNYFWNFMILIDCHYVRRQKGAPTINDSRHLLSLF